MNNANAGSHSIAELLEWGAQLHFFRFYPAAGHVQPETLVCRIHCLQTDTRSTAKIFKKHFQPLFPQLALEFTGDDARQWIIVEVFSPRAGASLNANEYALATQFEKVLQTEVESLGGSLDVPEQDGAFFDPSAH